MQTQIQALLAREVERVVVTEASYVTTQDLELS